MKKKQKISIVINISVVIIIIFFLDNILISFVFISIYIVFLLFYTLVTRADLMFFFFIFGEIYFCLAAFWKKLELMKTAMMNLKRRKRKMMVKQKKVKFEYIFVLILYYFIEKKKIKVENNPLKFYFPTFLVKEKKMFHLLFRFLVKNIINLFQNCQPIFFEIQQTFKKASSQKNEIKKPQFKLFF